MYRHFEEPLSGCAAADATVDGSNRLMSFCSPEQQAVFDAVHFARQARDNLSTPCSLLGVAAAVLPTCYLYISSLAAFMAPFSICFNSYTETDMTLAVHTCANIHKVPSAIRPSSAALGFCQMVISIILTWLCFWFFYSSAQAWNPKRKGFEGAPRETTWWSHKVKR